MKRVARIVSFRQSGRSGAVARHSGMPGTVNLLKGQVAGPSSVSALWWGRVGLGRRAAG
jgi:hypothetical protein